MIESRIGSSGVVFQEITNSHLCRECSSCL